MNVTLYHGGRNLEFNYRDMIIHKKGRWEYGPGLYLTTHKETARKYAKGGGRVYDVTVELNNDIKHTEISLDSAIEFIKRYCLKSKQAQIIDDLKSNLNRLGKLYAYVIVNLCINLDALPQSKTPFLRKYLIENGVDYAIDRYHLSNEFVVIVYNPDIIKSIKKTTDDSPSIVDLY